MLCLLLSLSPEKSLKSFENEGVFDVYDELPFAESASDTISKFSFRITSTRS